MKPFSQDRLTKLFFNLPKVKCLGPFLARNDDITTPGEIALIQSKKFSDSPFYSVPFYGIPQFPACGNPNSLDAQAVFHGNDRKMRRMNPFAQTI